MFDRLFRHWSNNSATCQLCGCVSPLWKVSSVWNLACVVTVSWCVDGTKWCLDETCGWRIIGVQSRPQRYLLVIFFGVHWYCPLVLLVTTFCDIFFPNLKLKVSFCPKYCVLTTEQKSSSSFFKTVSHFHVIFLHDHLRTSEDTAPLFPITTRV